MFSCIFNGFLSAFYAGIEWKKNKIKQNKIFCFVYLEETENVLMSNAKTRNCINLIRKQQKNM